MAVAPRPNYNLPVGTVEFIEFTVKGEDMLLYLLDVKMYQSILRPYIVCDFRIRDFDGVGNTMKLSGGEPISLIVKSREGYTMRWNGYVTKQTGDIDLDKRSTRGTIITGTNKAFLGNEVSKVTDSWKFVPGSSVIQEIHKKYLGGEPIHRFSPSLGMIGEEEPFIVRDERPFDAIAKIRYAITSSAYSRTGAYTYFRDIDGYVLLPLEQLITEAGVTALTFEERETIGSSATDIIRTSNGILDFKALTTFGGSATGGSAIAQAIKAVEGDMWNWMNMNTYVKGITGSVGLPSFGAGKFSPAVGSFGSGVSLRNYIVNDKRMNRISPQSIKAAGEKVTAEMIQNGPGYKMAVLFDLGSFLTVGRGCIAKPLSPAADTGLPEHLQPRDSVGGLGLIINLTHTLKNVRETRPQGVTIVEVAQGGFLQ